MWEVRPRSAWLLLAMACSGPGDSPTAAPACIDVSSSATRLEVVGGTGTPPDFLASAQDAVVDIETRAAGIVDCSGALVAPRWVLTAAHCFEGDPDATPRFVASGSTAACPSWRVGAVRAVLHPTLDAALVELESAAPGMPVPLSVDVPADVQPGAALVSAGYGEDETGQRGQRRYLVVTVGSIDSETLQVDGDDGGSCGGDSGGPLFAEVMGQSEVVGLLLGGSTSCRGGDVFLRTDLLTSWVESVVDG